MVVVNRRIIVCIRWVAIVCAFHFLLYIFMSENKVEVHYLINYLIIFSICYNPFSIKMFSKQKEIKTRKTNLFITKFVLKNITIKN